MSHRSVREVRHGRDGNRPLYLQRRRIIRDRFGFGCALVACVVVPLAGCGDGPSAPPAQTPTLSGVVRDAGGAAVENVSVALVYELDGFDLPKAAGVRDAMAQPSTTIRYELPEPSEVRAVILDWAGTVVRVLVAESLPPGSHNVIWDGRDDAGRQVGNGMYVFVLYLDGSETESLRRNLLLHRRDLMQLVEAPNAVTDADGRFELPMALVPVGVEVDVADAGGEPLGTYPISRDVAVHALIRVGMQLRHATATVHVDDPSQSHVANLELP